MLYIKPKLNSPVYCTLFTISDAAVLSPNHLHPSVHSPNHLHSSVLLLKQRHPSVHSPYHLHPLVLSPNHLHPSVHSHNHLHPSVLSSNQRFLRQESSVNMFKIKLTNISEERKMWFKRNSSSVDILNWQCVPQPPR